MFDDLKVTFPPRGLSNMTLDSGELTKNCPTCDVLLGRIAVIEQDCKILQELNARHELLSIFNTEKSSPKISETARHDSMAKPLPIHQSSMQSLVRENTCLKERLHKLDYVRNLWDCYIDTLQTVTERLETSELEIEGLRIKLNQIINK